MQYCQFSEQCITPAQMNLIFRARMLWRNAATWFRAYLANAKAGIDIQPINEKLYRTNLEYGNVLRVFFGDRITDDYLDHLNRYIEDYQAMFAALMGGDQKAVEEYSRKLYQNIDERAVALAQVNPFWQESEWKNLLYPFTDLLLQEASAIASGDCIKDVSTFDRLLTQSTLIGDYFSEGLINYLTYSGR